MTDFEIALLVCVGLLLIVNGCSRLMNYSASKKASCGKHSRPQRCHAKKDLQQADGEADPGDAR